MSDAPVEEVDAEPVEPAAPASAAPASTGRELVHHQGGHVAARNVRMEVIRPLDTAQVVETMREHQKLLEAILDEKDWQGRPEADGSFVKKSGWRKIALAYNLTMERVGEEVEYDYSGSPTRATYTARAIAANGRSVEATGHCAEAESRFKKDAARHKLENDMRATAETRAKNRAISDLIGMGKVSAEEAESGGGGAGGPAFGPEASDKPKVGAALSYLLPGGTHDPILQAIIKRHGYFPESVAVAIIEVAQTVRANNGGPPVPAPAPEPAPTTAPEPDVDHLTPEEEAEIARQAALIDDAVGLPKPTDAPAEPIVDATVVPDDARPRAADGRVLDEDIPF